MNNCGTCDYCCKYLMIVKNRLPDRLMKPAGELCKYYDNGCSLQDDKPKPCVDYKCYWLKLFEAGEVDTTQWRPNEVGFIVEVRNGVAYIDGDCPEDDHPLLQYIKEREGDLTIHQRYKK